MDNNTEQRILNFETAIEETESEIKQVEFLYSEMKNNKDKVSITAKHTCDRILNDLKTELEYLDSILQEQTNSLEFIKNNPYKY